MKRIQRLVCVFLISLLASPVAAAQSPEAEGEPSAFAGGLNTPATFIDERGNPVFELTVTELDVDWQEYDEYSAPDRGKIYVRMVMSITNLDDRDATAQPYSMVMVDNHGVISQQVYINAPDEAYWGSDFTVPGGGTVEGWVLFQMYDDQEPMMLMWQPEFSYYVFVLLRD